ncbi:MAG: UDP-N-acetylmuramoyl-L-alanine--D-glutamate ligase [Bacteroidota bacterium]|nr:UDP-N-acetylmuramoyl-L-alanine--D-glutamate ligase [Bacteroidota bacterium]
MYLEKIKNIVVLGAGESGVGSAMLASKNKFNVFVSDAGKISENFRKELVDNKIDFEENNHSSEKILKAELIIKSPGIPDTAEIIIKLKENKIQIISDIEFGSYFTKAKIISITGSNGKTTTTMLIYHIMKNAGLDVTVAGNIGTSLCRTLCEKDYKYVVLEISSFQLDYIKHFRSNIAILLNITPDHLDRYEYKMENYAKSKLKIAENQKEEDYFIYTKDDPVTMDYLSNIKLKAHKVAITQKGTLSEGAWTEKNDIFIKIKKHKQIKIDMNILSLIGTHNRYNSMAATATMSAIGVKDDFIRESLSNFESIEHRLEYVGKIRGKDFINDSKATNINATWYALESMTKPVIWIVGGIDKGNNYDELRHLVNDNVKAIVCLGIDNSKIIDAFTNDIDMIFDTSDMKEAVGIAFRVASPNNVVLLSPACASFDLFKNYKDRGIQFKNAVREL